MEIHFRILFHNQLQCRQAYNDLDARNAGIKNRYPASRKECIDPRKFVKINTHNDGPFSLCSGPYNTHLLMIFERKILRKIFGPTKEPNGLWRIKTNEELDESIQRKNIIRFIKSQRLKWLGHIERMQKEREVTKIYKWKPFASRPIGRPKNRWEDDLRKHLQPMKIKNWKRSVLDRDLWKKIVERTKTHTEL